MEIGKALLSGIPWRIKPIESTLNWRRAIALRYRYQYGLYTAVPVLWACLGSFTTGLWADLGFLSTLFFLELRPGKRMALQSLGFTIFSIYLSMASPSHPMPANVEAHTIRGTLVEETGSGNRTAWILETQEGRIRVQSSFGSRFVPMDPIPEGSLIEAKVTADTVPGPTNPGQFDFRSHLLSQGVVAVYKTDSLRVAARPNLLHRAVNALKDGLSAALNHTLPHAPECQRASALVKACLLGDTRSLDAELVEDFRNSGMLHIIAISGQHIGLLAMILLQVCSILWLPRKVGFGATALAVAVYVPVCGGSVSVARSAIMLTCMLPGIFWERPGATMNNLGWAAVACLVWRPEQILSLGFQLSFAATFFLVAYSRPFAVALAPLRRRRAALAGIYAALLMSAALYAGLYPILAASVHLVSPSSPLGNLVTIPVSSAMIASACLALLAYPLPLLPGLFGEAAAGCARALLASVHALAHGPGGACSAQTLATGWTIILLAWLVALPFAVRKGRARLLFAIGMTLIAGRWTYGQIRDFIQDKAVVEYLDVGQGDAALLRLPDAVILIDAGPPNAGRDVILPCLRAHGINRLDRVILTHPDLDHFGGLAYLAARFSIGMVVYPGIEGESQAWLDLRNILKERGIPVSAVRTGDTLYRYTEVTLRVLAPAFAGQFPDKNDNSVIALLERRGRKFLFTGDMGVPETEFLMRASREDIQGAVLKIPHHGSDRSNCLGFLRDLHPERAIISVGRHNRFGHPGLLTVKSLDSLEIPTLRTSQRGAIRCEMIGRSNSASPQWSSILDANGVDSYRRGADWD